MNKKYEIVKFKDNEIELDVNIDPKEETIWMTQDQISILFGKGRSTITEHINNILKDGEIDKEGSVGFSDKSSNGRPTKIYNMDIILAVGYRVNSKRGIQFRKWANKILKEYMLRGYVINDNRVVVTNENYLSLVESVNNINNEMKGFNNRLIVVEDKINSKELPLEKIFFDGEVYDAYEIIQIIFSSANNEIIIIDNYIDRSVLDRLKVKKQKVNIKIYTSINTKLLGRDIDMYNNQYGSLNVWYKTNIHDRFIIIDNKELYHLGASIKDAGKKVFAINKMDNSFINNLISNL